MNPRNLFETDLYAILISTYLRGRVRRKRWPFAFHGERFIALRYSQDRFRVRRQFHAECRFAAETRAVLNPAAASPPRPALVFYSLVNFASRNRRHAAAYSRTDRKYRYLASIPGVSREKSRQPSLALLLYPPQGVPLRQREYNSEKCFASYLAIIPNNHFLRSL